MKKEIWKDIENFKNSYQISNKGRVKSLNRLVNSRYGKRLVKGVFLKGIPDKDGYFRVNLKKKQKTNNRLIHRLVALSFSPNPKNKPHVNHKDGNKQNNVLSNLEWNTLSENRQHAYDIGLQTGKSRQGEKSNFSKLTEKKVLEIRRLYKTGKYTQKQIAKLHSITHQGISKIITKKTWKWLN